MNEHATKMLQAESAYLSGVASNLEAAKGKQFTGTIWQTSRDDDSDRLRALMAANRVYDRERLSELPHNRRISLHGYRRTWWFRKRRTGVAIASVLCPLEDLVTDRDREPGPIDLPELHAHVRKLVTDPSVDHVIGVCAPSGFTAAARAAKLELEKVTLVLVEPAPDGGWKVTSPHRDLQGHVLALFDPEQGSEKLERVQREIEERSAELLTAGLSASSIASRLGLPKDVVMAAVERVAAADPELRVSREADDVLLFRGATARSEEKTSMNVVDRIRQLFSRDGEEVEKINLLSERRAKLAQQRDRLYGDIAKLETKEADLVREGRENKSQVARRRLAAQLGQLRKDIGRQNTTASMLNQQINIISTDIHNLTLIQQGNLAHLPSTEELTENAVKAEEMLETLTVDSELVSSLETGLAEASMSEEELAIMKEFDEPSPPEKTAEPDRSAEGRAVIDEQTEPPAVESDREPEKRRADPEAG